MTDNPQDFNGLVSQPTEVSPLIDRVRESIDWIGGTMGDQDIEWFQSWTMVDGSVGLEGKDQDGNYVEAVIRVVSAEVTPDFDAMLDEDYGDDD